MRKSAGCAPICARASMRSKLRSTTGKPLSWQCANIGWIAHEDIVRSCVHRSCQPQRLACCHAARKRYFAAKPERAPQAQLPTMPSSMLRSIRNSKTRPFLMQEHSAKTIAELTPPPRKPPVSTIAQYAMGRESRRTYSKVNRAKDAIRAVLVGRRDSVTVRVLLKRRPNVLDQLARSHGLRRGHCSRCATAWMRLLCSQPRAGPQLEQYQFVQHA